MAQPVSLPARRAAPAGNSTRSVLAASMRRREASGFGPLYDYTEKNYAKTIIGNRIGIQPL
jgi:hypothetical protein